MKARPVILTLTMLLLVGPGYALDYSDTHMNKSGHRQAFADYLVFDFEICSIGTVQNYISNGTVERSTGTNIWTIIIGDDVGEHPSMRRTVPSLYADINDYLYVASLRLGYHGRLVHLSNDTSPGVDVLEPPDSRSDFDTRFYISDQTVLVPPEDRINVAVQSRTYAWSDTAFDDFIIYEYRISNLNPLPLDSFYAALCMDFDVSLAEGGVGEEAFFRDDWPGYYRDDATHEYISYMYDGDNPNVPGNDVGGNKEPRESTGFVGSRLLYCPPVVGSNVPTVQRGHDWWDWNTDPANDSEWFDFISDSVWMAPPPSIHDYRVLQKTGPFAIPANDSIRVAFALGIGDGLGGMRANLAAAWHKYDLLTGVDEGIVTTPSNFELYPNYPNPFNASTALTFRLDTAGPVNLSIYDLLGQRVTSLVNGHMEAGAHSVTWHANELPTGVYFARLTSGGENRTVKMALLK